MVLCNVGVNTHGQLGDGTCSSTINSDCVAENIFPGEGDSTVHVNLTSGLTVIAAATSSDSTCALLSDDSLHCCGAQSGEFDNTTDPLLNPYQLTFSDGDHIAYTEQDFDGDGVRNFFDTHQTGDNDGDGLLIQKTIIQTTPQDGQIVTRVNMVDWYVLMRPPVIQHRVSPYPDRVPARNFQPFTGKLPALMHPLAIM